jgi:hypothetical protein
LFFCIIESKNGVYQTDTELLYGHGYLRSSVVFRSCETAVNLENLKRKTGVTNYTTAIKATLQDHDKTTLKGWNYRLKVNSFEVCVCRMDCRQTYLQQSYRFS